MTKLIVFDMDRVIFEHVNFWLELHKAYDTYEEGVALTKKYGSTDYQTLVNEVIGRLWKDKPADVYFKLVNSIKYVKGAKETLKELKEKGFILGIVSSGPSHLAERAKKECGVDYCFANTLLIEDDKVVGSKDLCHWPIGWGKKKDPLKEMCELSGIPMENTIVVGHEENDIEMARESPCAIAFYPTSEELVKHCQVIIKDGEPDLQRILEHIPKITL